MTLSGQDFSWVQKVVLDRAAIQLAPEQEYLIRSRLDALARERGLAGTEALIAAARSELGGALTAAVVDAMTTNETSFFRDTHPFDALAHTILPDVIEQRKAERSITLWSAACSTGQEAYSLAMILAAHPLLSGWRIRIVATDVSKRVLMKGQEGIYSSLEIGRGLPARMLATHFDRSGPNFRVKPHLRAMVEWKPMNLAGDWPTLPVFDIVFMRNVLIYFPKAVVGTVLGKTRACLSRNGYLLLGSTENMLGVGTGFDSSTIGKTMVYRPQGARKEARYG